MSDTEDDISNEDLNNFFQDRNVTGDCQKCGENDWGVAAGIEEYKGNGAMLILNKEGGFAAPPPNIPTIYLVCDNCGFIWPIAKKIILDWKKGKESQEASN